MSETWTILRVLDWTRGFFESKGIESARLDAELIISHVLNVQRVMLYAHFDRPLDPSELAHIRELVKRRSKHEPVAYLLGSKEFWSLDFEVNKNVLIPRPDTEVLIEVCLDLLKDSEAPRLADVGTGSGCIAVALAHELKNSTVDAFEISAGAREVATRNISKNNVDDRVSIFESDLFSSREGSSQKYHLIASNLPYIPSGDVDSLSPEVKDHEPKQALDGGTDGLDLIRDLVAKAGKHLEPGGFLVLEAGFDQLNALENLLDSAGFGAIEVRKDYGGHPRVCSGTWPA
ncbi:MAG: peptide chain release factor N(5)-glutamine methyltransferase [Myxococcota bacterium]|nr:peptide chain release factor N(5)-glutamine methyltransferase [Myxococcota bacterium]